MDPRIMRNISLLPPYQSFGGLEDPGVPGLPNPEIQSCLPVLQLGRPQVHWRPCPGPYLAQNLGRPVVTRLPGYPSRKPHIPPKIRTGVSHVAILDTGPETDCTWNVTLGRSGLCEHEHALGTQKN